VLVARPSLVFEAPGARLGLVSGGFKVHEIPWNLLAASTLAGKDVRQSQTTTASAPPRVMRLNRHVEWYGGSFCRIGLYLRRHAILYGMNEPEMTSWLIN
jgi:hypothetical protein